jgi:hypothetical protein
MHFAQLRARLLRDPGRLSPDPVKDLAALGAVREPMAGLGLWFVRRVIDGDLYYFIVNPTARPVSGWIPIGTRARYALLLDPMSGDAGLGAIRDTANANTSEVHLQLDSGQSILLRAAYFPPTKVQWRTLVAAGEPRALDGPWSARFVDAAPGLRTVRRLPALTSWTGWSSEAQRFSGTVRYRHEFRAPTESADEWLLDLGEVRETARVTLNGSPLGITWALPASVRLGDALQPGRNVLEIEVTNLPANRVRDLDLRKVDWKIMKDINLASLKYRALDAAAWEPQPSGLLGPVSLVPMKLVSPEASPRAP